MNTIDELVVKNLNFYRLKFHRGSYGLIHCSFSLSPDSSSMYDKMMISRLLSGLDKLDLVSEFP